MGVQKFLFLLSEVSPAGEEKVVLNRT